jgi:hypothetical protein
MPATMSDAPISTAAMASVAFGHTSRITPTAMAARPAAMKAGQAVLAKSGLNPVSSASAADRSPKAPAGPSGIASGEIGSSGRVGCGVVIAPCCGNLMGRSPPVTGECCQEAIDLSAVAV